MDGPMDHVSIWFWVTVSLAGLVFHGLAAGAFYLLYAFTVTAFGRTPPSGPAALGRAFGLLFLFEVVGTALLAYLCPIVFQSWQPDAREVAELALRLVLFLTTPVLAASVAVISSEDVRTLNAWIYFPFGLFIHIMISLFAFIESSLMPYAMLAFMPFTLIGYRCATHLRTCLHASHDEAARDGSAAG